MIKKSRVIFIISTILFLSVLWTKVFSQVPEVEKNFHFAESLYDAQEFGLAKYEYLKIIHLYSKNQYSDIAQFKVGECLMKSGNFWFAIEEWEKLIKNFPESKYVNEAKKQIKYAKLVVHDWERPLTTQQEHTANKCIGFGNDFRGRLYLTTYGLITRQENIDKALYWFDEALRICPKGELAAKAQYFKGDLYRGLFQQDGPEKYFQRVREQDKIFITKALQEYQKVIDNYPETFWVNLALRNIGDIYSDNLRDKTLAINAYKKLVEKNNSDPDNYYVSYASAQITYLNTLFDYENEIFKTQMHNWEPRLLTAEEHLSNKYMDLGNVFRGRLYLTTYGLITRQENIDKALYWFDEALKICPKGEIAAKAQFFKGELYLGLFQQDAPEKYFARIREQDKNFITKALQEYQKVVDNYPDTWWAIRALEQISAIYEDRLRDKTQASNAYQQLIEKSNNMGIDNNYYVSVGSAQITYLNTLFDYDNTTFKTQMYDWEARALTAEEHLSNKYIGIAQNFAGRSIRSGEFGIVYNKEELEAAFYWINKAIEVCPQGSPLIAKAQYFKGDFYIQQQRQSDYDKALEEYQKVIENYPNTHWANEAGIKRGDVYKDIIRDKGASIKAYKEVVIRNKGDLLNRYVSYAITQIKYLDGSLKFMEEIK